MTWITDITARLTAATGIEPGILAVDAADADIVLRLAALAAHESGERINAPLLCHVLGRAVALGIPLEALARIVEGTG